MKNQLKANIISFFVIFSMLLSALCIPTTMVIAAPITFTGTEMIGRPEADSVSISIVPDSDISLYYEYGTSSGVYTLQTPITTATGGTPKVVVIDGLTANTRYYYRMQYSTNGGTTWEIRDEHEFQTQRAPGSTFTFDITSDSHVNIQLGNATTWTNTLNDVADDSPDFLIDLGDTFAMDNGSTSVPLGDIAAAESKYIYQLSYFNIISASSAIFLVPGNHEQQEAWHLQGTLANSLPVMSKNAEKKFFLNPVPDAFYSGDASIMSELDGDQTKQDYFSWTWGDALFVVISPYWYTTTKPYTTLVGGGETDATGSGNRWDWTLGEDQFNWLKTTLENSTAKYKFVFSHQIVGGNSLAIPNQVNYGHGGVDSANLVEWGGYDVGGINYTWDTNRPGWGSQPIGEMMAANGVTAFFHGHDHQYAYEKLGDMVYQAVPSASFTTNFGIYSTGGNDGKTIQALTSTGHLRVTVGPEETTVEYIRTGQTTSSYTYSMEPTGATTYSLTAGSSGHGSVTLDPTGGTYVAGTIVTLTPVPDTGYHFVSWTGPDAGDIEYIGGVYSIEMDEDKSVTANFAINTYNLTVNAGTGGTITAPPAPVTTHDHGSVVPITAAPASGYHFVNWTGDVSTVVNVNAASTTITMYGNYNITANFAIDIYYLYLPLVTH